MVSRIGRNRNLIIILLIIIVIVIIYYFPLQYFLAINRFDDYIALQGIYTEDISDKITYKDYTQGGYYIDVIYKGDPLHRYEYHYYLFDFRNSGIKVNSMYCYIYDQHNNQLDSYEETLYKPLE